VDGPAVLPDLGADERVAEGHDVLMRVEMRG
jgi:hypothetical protein